MLNMPKHYKILSWIKYFYLISGQIPDYILMYAGAAFISIPSHVKRNLSFTFCPLDGGNDGMI